MSILEVNNVSKSFGGVKANVDISMSVDKGKIVGEGQHKELLNKCNLYSKLQLQQELNL